MRGAITRTEELPARRLSEPMPKTAWRLPAKLVGKISLSLNAATSNKGNTKPRKQVRFSKSKTKYPHPYVQPQLKELDLWYSLDECKQMLADDVNGLLDMGATVGSPEARGLELYVVSEGEYMLRKSAMSQYQRAIVQMSRDSNQFYKKALLKTSKRRKAEWEDVLREKSLDATELNKDYAFGLACADELDARKVFEEDEEEETPVKSETALAA